VSELSAKEVLNSIRMLRAENLPMPEGPGIHGCLIIGRCASSPLEHTTILFAKDCRVQQYAFIPLEILEELLTKEVSGE